MDGLLALALVVILAAFGWLERARLLALVARPPRTVENGSGVTRYYWRLTRQAGLSPYESWPYVMGAKVVLAVGLPLAAMWAFGSSGWALLLAPVGFMLPDAIIASMRRKRQAAIRRDLSFFVDLMVSLLMAGLGLEEAFGRTAREGLPKSHPLAQEARRVVDELAVGRDRSQAFRMLADRTGVAELQSLANAIGIGLTHGGSIEATLKTQADVLRAKRREDGLKRLSIASAKVLLPLMLCGFPVFIALVFVPLIIRLAQSLSVLGSVLRVR